MIEIALRDKQGSLKFIFDNRAFDKMHDDGILNATKKTRKTYKDAEPCDAFTFQADLVYVTPMGKLYLWKGDYLAVRGL
jgi:hypothetical protein